MIYSLITRSISVISRFERSLYRIRRSQRLREYHRTGRLPWTRGYDEYKWSFISSVINNQSLVKLFLPGGTLPNQYGYSLDERCVEYPWILAHMPHGEQTLLDAGSTMNFAELLHHTTLHKKQTTIVNLNPEAHCFWNDRISYDFCDIRELPYKDETFEIITCISTLEHVGMDNTIYHADAEREREGFIPAIRELWRVLKKGGTLLATVPYGVYRNFGFFQQFDSNMIDTVISQTGVNKHTVVEQYFHYSKKGWQQATREQCDGSEYFNIQTRKSNAHILPHNFDEDRAAAARAVACIKLIK